MTPILVCYRGSIAHNMYAPSSDPHAVDDIDLMAFGVAPPNHYYGLTKWGSRGTKEYQRGEYDVVMYEIRKAVGLLESGNPNVLSMLWCRDEEVVYQTKQGAYLRVNRDLFHGRHLYRPFAGYAHAQARRMVCYDRTTLQSYLDVVAEMKFRGIHPQQEKADIGVEDKRPSEEVYRIRSDDELRTALRQYHKKNSNLGYLGEKRKRLILERGYDTKNAAHLVRLLWMCEQYLRYGVMNIWVPDAQAEVFRRIKRGEVALVDVQRWADQSFETCRRLYHENPVCLPEKPDRAKVESLLMTIIRDVHASSLPKRPPPQLVHDPHRQWSLPLLELLRCQEDVEPAPPQSSPRT